MKSRTKNKKNGFALLIAVVTTALLLLVSFVVVNTALKQVVISYSNQESQHAYYNTESGLECAIYWDLKNPSGTSAFATGTASTINCNGTSYTVGGGGLSNATTTFTINSLQPKGCVTVKVAKVPDPALYGLTRIEAYGYNNCSSSGARRVERGITITY